MASQDIALTPTQPATPQLMEAPRQPLAVPVHGRLVSTAGPELKYDLLEGVKEITVGRHWDCHIVVDDKRLSAKHLRIYLEEPRNYYVEQLGSNGSYVNEHALKKGHRRALQHGDEISLCMHARETRAKPFAVYMFQVPGSEHGVDDSVQSRLAAIATPQNSQDAEKRRQHKSLQWVHQTWDMRTVIGSGAFSEVRLGVRVRTGERFAVKVIDKLKFTTFQRGRKSRLTLQCEARMLAGLDHPGIVRVNEWFETDQHLYLVMELLEGGDLLDFIMKRGAFSEDASRRIFAEVLQAVEFLHSQNVVHRDLKPENLMLTARNEEASVKIVDFGLAKSAPQSKDCRTFCGTPQYFAPEIISTFHDRTHGQRPEADCGYGKQVDMWSLGVILYIMLSGVPPFDDQEAGGLYKQILDGSFEFDVPEWSIISPEAKDLVEKLMIVNPRERLTVEQALAHAWLKQPDSRASDDMGSCVFGEAFDVKRGEPPTGAAEGGVKRRRTMEVL